MRWKFQGSSTESSKNARGPAQEVSVELVRVENDRFEFLVDQERVVLENIVSYPYSIHSKQGSLTMESWRKDEWRVSNERSTWILRPVSHEAGQKSGSGTIKSQMPGKILKLLVKEGDSVSVGQSLLIMEAMKMENEIRAEVAARVSKIHVQAGASVEAGNALLSLSSEAES